jgi:ubiquinone/menaquinone biosynthesis C-methylase UbiE
MLQRTDEWTKTYNDDYFNRQFTTPYRSTVIFCNWLEEIGVLNGDSDCSILDIATGKGATMYYMKRRFPKCEFLGLDINSDFVEQGNHFIKQANIDGIRLQQGDLYNLDYATLSDKYEGVIMLQTLSWLPEAESALTAITKLKAKWIALSSLFYDGMVDCKTEISEYQEDKTGGGGVKYYKSSYYNTYSIPLIKNILERKGYTDFKYMPFELDMDLPKPTNSLMGTYTEKLITGKRIQISGPLLMNWHFIYATKS